MQIIWQGQACFQIITQRARNSQVKIIIDPFDETLGLKVPSLEGDILLLSHSHYDHNNVKAVKGEPFLVDGPGEYEIKEVLIQGIPAFHDNCQGKERGEVTIYTIEAEEIKICHLGDLGQRELSVEQLERIGDVDILMIPVGGTYTISSKEAPKIISQIEPKIVIPMHYQIPKLKIHPVKSCEAGISPKAKSFNGVKLEAVDKFLKAMGQKSLEPQQKLNIRKKDLLKEETKVVLLKP